MNVLFLSEVTAANARNGAERTLREQVLGLGKRGHAVSVVTRAMAEDPRLAVSVDGATEHRYPFSRRNEVAFVLSSVVGSLRTLNGAAVRHDFDATLIHQSLAGLGPIIFQRARARRWVYMCLSLAHEEYLSRNQPGKTPGGRAGSHAAVFTSHRYERFYEEARACRTPHSREQAMPPPRRSGSPEISSGRRPGVNPETARPTYRLHGSLHSSEPGSPYGSGESAPRIE